MSYVMLPAGFSGETGRRYCREGEYLSIPQNADPSCVSNCPPGWRTYEMEGDTACEEPAGIPSVADECPGMYTVYEQGAYRQPYCSPNCPAGWFHTEPPAEPWTCFEPTPGEQGQEPTPPPAEVPGSTPQASATPRPTATEPSEAGIAVADLPWWAYVAGAAALLGAAAYYARG